MLALICFFQKSATINAQNRPSASADGCYEFISHFKFPPSAVTFKGRNRFPVSSHMGRTGEPCGKAVFCSPLDRAAPCVMVLRAHPKAPALWWASSSCSHMSLLCTKHSLNSFFLTLNHDNRTFKRLQGEIKSNNDTQHLNFQCIISSIMKTILKPPKINRAAVLVWQFVACY